VSYKFGHFESSEVCKWFTCWI